MTADGVAKLQVFVSYAHEDSEVVGRLVNHLKPLESKYGVTIWLDKKNIPGSNFLDSIEKNLAHSDVILLCLSSDYFVSVACMQEARKALGLRESKAVTVIPVVLSDCAWLDVDDPCLNKLLALPADGKPISNFSSEASGFQDVYLGLRKIIEDELKIRNPNISEVFVKELDSLGIFSAACDARQSVTLDDVYIYPTLQVCDPSKDEQKYVKADGLIRDIPIKRKIVISGENQSGKTALAKKVFKDLLGTALLPVLLRPKDGHFGGTCKQLIEKAFSEQYAHCKNVEVDHSRLAIIVDDFHLVRMKDKMLDDLASYSYCVVFIDDIINLDFQIEQLLGRFLQYRIRQFSKTERYNLIKKWIDSSTVDKSNGYYQRLDEKVEVVESTLGKIFGNGIMPAYPFFVLSAVILQETAGNPLDQEISSQGYCYQALVYFYLRRTGVKNDEIDTYINFMSVIAYYMYKKNSGMNEEELDGFLNSYESLYNLPISRKELLGNLNRANLFTLSNVGAFDFSCKYLNYFFAAKYVAEHFEQEQEAFVEMVKDIHMDKNAYILIFVAHHTKKTAVVEAICQNASSLLSDFAPCRLTTEELRGFENQLDVIMRAMLPKEVVSPENARQELLKGQEEIETRNAESQTNDLGEDEDIRRFIRVSEVLGRIAKNRAGSFEREQLRKIVQTQLDLHARFISNFVQVATEQKWERLFISLVSENLEKILARRQSKHEVPPEVREKLARSIFWNINFWVLKYSVGSCISCIGSKKLRSVIDEQCDSDTSKNAFSMIVKYGIHMWNCKELEIEPMLAEMSNFSEIAKRLIKFFVVDYCIYHKIDYSLRQKVERSFELSPNSLLQEYEKSTHS